MSGHASHRLTRFRTLITLAGLPLAAWVTGHGVAGGWPSAQVLLLAAVLAVGELLPIEVSRRGRSSDEITISSTFALALILVAPLAVAIGAQALPLVVDDLRRGKHWGRPLFNIAQYSLTFGVTRSVYCLLSGQDFLSPQPFLQPELLPAFAAGAAFFLVNHTLVGTAVALWSHQPVLPHLLDDVRFQLSTSGLLVALAPAVLVLSDFSLLLVPVLLLPIAAVRPAPSSPSSASTTRCTTP